MSTEWRIGSLDIRNKAFNIVSADGWDAYPPRRGSDIVIPFRHGSYSTGRKFYDPREVVLGILIMPFNTAGAVTHAEGGSAHIRENKRNLFAELYANDLISVQRDEPAYPGAGIVTYEAMCYVADMTPVREAQGKLARLFIPRFISPDPFWRILPEQTSVGTPSVTNNGIAPVADMVITFTGGTDPKLTNTTTGEWIQITDGMASPVTVDVGLRTVTQGGSPADALFTKSHDWWMEFVPGVNSLSLTGGGSVSIDFYDKDF